MKTVIFDRDGVIVDSEGINVNASSQALKEQGIKITDEDKDFIVGKHPADYVVYFKKKYSFDEKVFMKREGELYHQMIEELPIFENIVSLIKQLKNKGFKLALTTTSGIKSTTTVLDKTGLNKVFDVVVTFEDYKHRKPHPDPYLTTLKKLGSNADDCIVIEDTEIGIEAAKAAGMKCIALPNSFTKNQDFSKADLVVSQNEINVEIIEQL